MRLRSSLAAAFTVLAAAPAAALPPPLSKEEIRSAPPSETHRRLRDQVWEMFERQDFREGGKATQPLWFLTLPTAPYGGYVPNLCRLDEATFRFHARGGPERGAATPVRPVGIETAHFFHFLKPPPPESADTHILKADEGGWRPPPVPAWDGACRRLDPKKVRFFGAESEHLARDGMIVFQLFLEALRAAPPGEPEDGEIDFGCDLAREEKEAGRTDCRVILAAYAPADLLGVRRCESEDRHRSCYDLEFANRAARIEVGRYDYRDPWVLKSVSFTLYVGRGIGIVD